MTAKRQLAAIMFTDITGYSAMMEADEEYARRIRKQHRTVFKDAHGRHDGNILQYYGDGTLSIFTSAAAAVECAVDMQIEFRKEPEVPLRIGIHTGDISYDDEGAYGDGLNIAARIEKLSVPGSVYISAKVYDDIKNHRWLTAASLGLFQLRNIHRDFEIYAVTCKGMEFPTDEEIEAYPEHIEDDSQPKQQTLVRGHKRKGVATVLAFFFGIWGVHRFYLGQRKRGLFWLIAAFISLMITIDGAFGFPPIAIFGLIGFLDFILLLAMPRAEFDLKYNKIGEKQTKASRKSRRKKKREPVATRRWEARPAQSKYRSRPQPATPAGNPALTEGIRLYKQENYFDAIEEFKLAIEVEDNSTAAYFNLACCYSILQNPQDAYYYLAKAVEKGFSDYDRIQSHEALSDLRERDDFASFVDNGYRVVAQLPEPQEDLIENLQKFNPDILEKIESLGDLMEKGDLTREEFEEQKKRILGHD
jgi:class 3 adenylate cyclase/TM2 domain-containing membrane protein YozV